MKAHAAPEDRGGRPEDRPANAGAAADRSNLPGDRPADDGAMEVGPMEVGAMEVGAASDEDAGPEDRLATVATTPAQAGNPLERRTAGRRKERGWPSGEAPRRSGLPRSTVYTLATTRNLVRPPRPATINGLAKGLEVPASAVRPPAAESTGMHYYDEPPADPQRGVPGDQERELLIASIAELSAEDRRHVAALVESLRNRPAPPPTGLPCPNHQASGISPFRRATAIGYAVLCGRMTRCYNSWVSSSTARTR